MSDVESAFRKIWAWVAEGLVKSEYTGTPYRWEREGLDVTHMRHSPAGEFICLHRAEPKLVIYLRPGKSGEGFSQRIDLRCGKNSDVCDLASLLGPETAA